MSAYRSYQTIGLTREIWQALITEGSHILGVTLDTAKIDALAQHGAELTIWNRRMNLTAIRNPREMAVKHFVDSLAPAVHLQSGQRVLDIGSGAGFPGIPLKIALPDLELTLVDAQRRKCSFLRHVCRVLGIGDTAVHHMHLTRSGEDEKKNFESDPDLSLSTPFDVIVSRAVGSISGLIGMGKRYLKPDGVLIALKGPDDQDFKETAASPQYQRWKLESQNYRLPHNQGQRKLVFLRRR